MSFSTDNVCAACFLVKDNNFSSDIQAVLGNASLTLWTWLDLPLICAICMQACIPQGKSLITHTGPSSYVWAGHRLRDMQGQACHRSVHLQIFQLQFFLTMAGMLWIQLEHCQQWWKVCCLQDSVYLLLLNQLSNHCTDTVQSTKKCSSEQDSRLLYKSNFCVTNKTIVLRKNFP